MPASPLPDIIAPIRRRIAEQLRLFLSEKRSEMSRVNPLGPDLCDRLLEFSLPGKMIRGWLVTLGRSLCGGSPPPEPAADPAIRAGAAMELLQSGLLVHDDIMDRDLTRRGKPSLFSQYAETASRRGSADPLHEGEALGICAGDVAYFLAIELLGRMEAAPDVIARAVGLCARELSLVGVAQMQDVAGGPPPGEEEILRMYAYKTARYTFSLPLMLGAAIAGAGPRMTSDLECLGQDMGVLFQVRDDELGLFGSEEELGKPVGSDVREGKKTLFHACLMAAADPEDRVRLAGIFGNRACSDEDLAYARERIESLGVRAHVERLARSIETRARETLAGIPLRTAGDRETLEMLLDYTTARRR